MALGADTRAMLRITLFSGALATVLIVSQGLVFPSSDVYQPLIVCLLLLGVAVFYHAVRPAPNFVLVLKALCLLVAFSSVYCVLMYAVATGGRPLADAVLARLDAALGLSAPQVVQWVNERPIVALVMWFAYFSLVPQTILAIACLGLANDRYHLDKFLLRFIVASLITIVGFYFWPAKGTYGSVYELAVPAHCQRCLEHFDALRSGALTVVTWRNAEGLITFPSFHTIWAVLLAAAFHGWRRTFGPMVVLNALVVVSTVTTGMHYFSDVIAGLLIAAAVIWLTKDPAAENRPGMAQPT